jgi:cytochrome c556
MKNLIFTGAFILSSIFSFNAIAQMSDEDAAAAIKRRQSVFQILAHSNGPLGAMARGGEYNAEVAERAARRVAMVAPMIPEVIAAADTRGSAGTTRALDAIWDNQDDIAALAQDLADGANAALAILESQGADGVREAVGMIGPKCGACHDRFRSD